MRIAISVLMALTAAGCAAQSSKTYKTQGLRAQALRSAAPPLVYIVPAPSGHGTMCLLSTPRCLDVGPPARPCLISSERCAVTGSFIPLAANPTDR